MTAVYEDPIRLQILRNRLAALIAEAETALLKASFSTIISLARDFSVELLDSQGRGLAHSARSVAEFSAILPITMGHFLARYPSSELSPGDILITNDPWQCAGHLGDFTLAMPIFRNDRVVAFMTSMAHHSDVGGTMDDVGARDVYEEGIWVPITKLYRAGKLNQDVLDIIRANVRTPYKVEGDLHAQVSSCEVGARQLQVLMDEFGLDEVDGVAQSLYTRARLAMEDAIESLPDGDYASGVDMDGLDEQPLYLRATLSVRGRGILVDYTGTSDQVQAGINSAWNFTFAETVNAIKSVLMPDIPSTEGCFAPIKVTAPPGCILNPRSPAPVKGRSRTGFQIQPIVFGALWQVVPEKVQAHTGGGNLIAVNGETVSGTRFNAHLLLGGGLGAKASMDGVNTLNFPTSSGAVPVEIFENQTPLIVERKEFAPDSGGPGRHRGGLGQTIHLHLPSDFCGSVTLSIRPQMMNVPASGLAGGMSGSRQRLFHNGSELTRKSEPVQRGSLRLEPGDCFVTVESGGGGFGPAEERSTELVERDLLGGYITQAHAESYYTSVKEHDRVVFAAPLTLGNEGPKP